MKFKISYTILIFLLYLVIYPYNCIAKELIGKVIKINRNQNKIQVEIYDNSSTHFSWAKLFGFKIHETINQQIITIKLNNKNINKLSTGNFIRLIGKYKTNKEFIVKQLLILPKDPTGVRERLGLIRRHRKRNYHNIRHHNTYMHIHYRNIHNRRSNTPSINRHHQSKHRKK